MPTIIKTMKLIFIISYYNIFLTARLLDYFLLLIMLIQQFNFLWRYMFINYAVRLYLPSEQLSLNIYTGIKL